jgi:protein-tyrosine phosphatase
MEDSRIVALEGAHNFRDLGGYKTVSGRLVRSGLVYRSGALAGLTAADQQRLAQLGIKMVVDLRSNKERHHNPTRWDSTAPTKFWWRDYDDSGGDTIMKLITHPAANAASMREKMIQTYHELPYEQADSYREMFRQIAAGELPLLFHCAAGKDRTGIAAALLLELLGVPRATIMADYLLSAVFFERISQVLSTDAAFGRLASVDKAVLQPLMGVEARYLEAMVEIMEQGHGSVAGYMRDVLQVDEAMAGAIREKLLD